jgi:hypothetical protein
MHAMVDTVEREVTASPARPAGDQRSTGDQRPLADAAVTRSRWSPARLAYWFYGVAATGAVAGQTWVAVEHLPWGAGVPFAARVVAVSPFALCLELLAMALAAMADERMRLGERAYGFRACSAVVAVVAIGIQVAGHWPQLYWSGVFGMLSGSAYLLWSLHAAARRRDALRAAGKLADTAPDYGLWRRVRHPVWTARAAQLAREGRVDAASGLWRPLGLYESLRAAQSAIRDEKRRPAVAAAVQQVVRADQRDPRMAEVAVRTLDLDRLAAELASRVDYGAWADRLAPAITAPVLPAAVSAPPPSVEMTAPAITATEPPRIIRPPANPTADNAAADVRHGVADGTPSTPGTAAASDADRSAQAPAHHALGREDQAVGCDGMPSGAAGAESEAASRESALTADPGHTVNGDVLPGGGEPANPVLAGRARADCAPDADVVDRPPIQTACGEAPVPADTSDEDEPGSANHNPGAEVDDAGKGGNDGDDDTTVPSETAAAVAYWYRRDPSMHPAEIGARIGRSERTVRRHWSTAAQRATNGHDTSRLAEQSRVS